MSGQLFPSGQDKARLSFFYDRNWKPFRKFIRKRFRLPSTLLRKIYEESFSRLAGQIQEGSAITVPLKIALYRTASEAVRNWPAEKRKELPDASAFQAEWREQERYIRIYQVVKAWFDEGEDSCQDEGKYVCVRKVAGMGAIEWTGSVPHDEEINRQKEIERYLFGEMTPRERFTLEKILHKDKAFRSQYEAMALFTDTANNVADDEELKEIIKIRKAEDVQSLFKEKQANRRFLWQAGLAALILFLLKLLMGAFY